MSGASGVKWTEEEICRFFRAFHKFGQEFDKVSKMVGGGKGPTLCELLHRRHSSYLSLPAKFQSEVAFVAMVEDAGHVPLEPDDLSEDGDADDFSTIRRHIKDDDVAHNDLDNQGYATEKQSAYASPTRSASLDEGAQALAAAAAIASPQQQGTLAATRPRRTPKRPNREAGMARTPVSASKRARPTRDDDIYEFYDEGAAITGSARKRRAAAVARDHAALDSSRRLDFGGGRRRAADELDDEKAVEALFALAGNDSLQGNVTASEDDLEDEEEDNLAMADNESDEDYRHGRYSSQRKNRRKGGANSRYTTTPDKTRRPGSSSHVTPRNRGKGGHSTGNLRLFGSPGWLNGLGDKTLLDDGDATYQHLTALVSASPGFGGGPGFVPSPQHPLPRLRRRKFPVLQTRPMISPLKGLFSRRQSISGTAASLLSMTGLGASSEDSVGPFTPAEAALRHCLHARARKWAYSEFFYSAIDRPWFLENPMKDLLNHMGLGRVGRMKKDEWNIVRSALGKPRRFSFKFLHEQRAKLEKWREAVREFYSTEDPDEKLAASYPKSLTVGQRVIARHPSTRQIHDGSILTIASNCYRIQFDRRELGVELINDTDVMPIDPYESLPYVMTSGKPTLLLNGRLTIDGRPVRPRLPPGIVRQTQTNTEANAIAAATIGVVKPDSMSGMRPEHDIAAMAELAASLDKKEAILSQLRAMNDEMAAGVHSEGAGIATSDFIQAYATVVFGMKEVNDTVNAKIAALDNPPAVVPEVTDGGAADGTAQQQEGIMPDGTTQQQQQQPMPQMQVNATLLAETALEEARRVVNACKSNLVTAAAKTAASLKEENPNAVAPPALNWTTPEGVKLSSLIEGAVWLLVMLQHGAVLESLPMDALVAALDVSLEVVRPKSGGNVELHSEIAEAMKALKFQLLAT